MNELKSIHSEIRLWGRPLFALSNAHISDSERSSRAVSLYLGIISKTKNNKPLSACEAIEI